jgi:hypothetical protein
VASSFRGGLLTGAQTDAQRQKDLQTSVVETVSKTAEAAALTRPELSTGIGTGLSALHRT